MTNATKAMIVALVNSGFGLLIVFDVVLTTIQQGAISLFANSALAVWIALTYKDSPKRIPDDVEARSEALR